MGYVGYRVWPSPVRAAHAGFVRHTRAPTYPIPEPRGDIMFIYEKASFPSCHASTLVETSPGKLLAAWFGGTDEGAKDVQIWASAFDGKSWSPPEVLGTSPGQPCWNPVLFKAADGGLILWYKAGPSPETWV